MHNEVAFPLHAARGAAYLTAPNIAARHAFSTRLGGVSTGVLESLNLSVRRGDTPENVRENWRRLGAAAGLDLTRAVYAQQVHSAEVRIAHAADAQPPELEPRFACDGFVTNEPGVPLAVFMADCLPVLLHDPAAGVIGAVHCGFMNNDQRYAGYCDALEEAGIAPNPDNLMTNLFPFNAERGIALGRQLAARRDFTGICVSGDQYAAAVITGLREGGARVPEDVSIVGFDDVDIARMTFPPLTTIHQDGIGKGRRAAEAIFALIDGENPDPKDFNLPVELVVRGTTAKAK